MAKSAVGWLTYALTLTIFIAAFFSTAVAAGAYVTGTILCIGASFWMPKGASKDDILDAAIDSAARSGARSKLGRTKYLLANGVHKTISIINWPIDVVRGLYLIAFKGMRSRVHRAFLSGYDLVPAWIGPPLFTSLALILLNGDPPGFPLTLLTYVFIASTFLFLVSRLVYADVKDAVLRGPGNIKLSFLLIFLISFGNVALARQSLERLHTDAHSTVFQSAYSIFAFSDPLAIANEHGLTLSEIAEDPNRLAALADVPTPLLLQAALGILFYLGFLRSGLDIFGAAREPRHYIHLGASYAVCGDLDRSEAMLARGVPERDAYQWLIAVRFARRAYQDLTRAATRLCGIIGVEFAPEEEAAMALLQAPPMLPVDAKLVADYLAHRSGDFSDPHAAALFAMLTRASLASGWGEIEDFTAVPALKQDPLFDLYARAERGEMEALPEGLRKLAIDSVSGRLLRVLLWLSYMMNKAPGTVPDPVLLSWIDQDLRVLADDRSWHNVHWLVLFGSPALCRARNCYRELMGSTHEVMEEQIRLLSASTTTSESLGEWATFHHRT